MNHRYDFVYLFDCKDGNPNGDPDAANSPRIDPQDMHGLVSDVCLKRKIRNFALLAKERAAGFDIFVQQGSVFNEKILDGHKAAGNDVELVRDLQPDLAILDVKMPGIDGLEAAGIITAEKLCGVLILTAFSQREVIEQARDTRCAGVPRQAVPEERPDSGDRGRDRPLPGTAQPHRRDRRARRTTRSAQVDRPCQGPADGRVRDEGIRGVHVHPTHGDE